MVNTSWMVLKFLNGAQGSGAPQRDADLRQTVLPHRRP